MHSWDTSDRVHGRSVKKQKHMHMQNANRGDADSAARDVAGHALDVHPSLLCGCAGSRLL